MTEHIHVDMITAVTIIAVYVIFKLALAIARARFDDESAFIQAINALQL